MFSWSEEDEPEIWFAAGSQELYGDETSGYVTRHSRELVENIDREDTPRAG